MTNTAIVIYDGSTVSMEDILDEIEDIGFDAELQSETVVRHDRDVQDILNKQLTSHGGGVGGGGGAPMTSIELEKYCIIWRGTIRFGANIKTNHKKTSNDSSSNKAKAKAKFQDRERMIEREQLLKLIHILPRESIHSAKCKFTQRQDYFDSKMEIEIEFNLYFITPKAITEHIASNIAKYLRLTDIELMELYPDNNDDHDKLNNDKNEKNVLSIEDFENDSSYFLNIIFEINALHNNKSINYENIKDELITKFPNLIENIKVNDKTRQIDIEYIDWSSILAEKQQRQDIDKYSNVKHIATFLKRKYD